MPTACRIEETLTLLNRGSYPVSLPEGRCGFVLPVSLEGDSVSRSLAVSGSPAVTTATASTVTPRNMPTTPSPGAPHAAPVRNDLRVEDVEAVVVSPIYSTGVIPVEYSGYASDPGADGRLDRLPCTSRNRGGMGGRCSTACRSNSPVTPACVAGAAWRFPG
ncbi:MAG: hypothetical protein U0Q18_23750 [Bryobacteraceae bacterium]